MGYLSLIHILTRIEEEGVFYITINKTLAVVLLTNMLKNAFVHNMDGGHIRIVITPHSVMLSLIHILSVTGRETARTMYGCNGWVAHHNTDIWRATGPVDKMCIRDSLLPEKPTWNRQRTYLPRKKGNAGYR